MPDESLRLPGEVGRKEKACSCEQASRRPTLKRGCFIARVADHQ
jgi:hypothetical protein